MTTTKAAKNFHYGLVNGLAYQLCFERLQKLALNGSKWFSFRLNSL